MSVELLELWIACWDCRTAAPLGSHRRGAPDTEVVRVGDALLRALTDHAARLDVLGVLCDVAPTETLAAARAGGLPAIDVPGMLWLHQVWDDGVVEPRPAAYLEALASTGDETATRRGAATLALRCGAATDHAAAPLLQAAAARLPGLHC